MEEHARGSLELPSPGTHSYFDHSAGIEHVMFWTLVTQGREYREFHSFEWPTKEKDVLGKIVVRQSDSRGVGAVIAEKRTAALVRFYIGGGSISGMIAAPTRLKVEETIEMLREWYPRSAASEDEVPITFWSYSPNGPRSINRQIAVPAWADVSDNYAGDTREHLERMMVGFRPSHGGQLALWQGVPGTGKTWALRALAFQWREWAAFHYVTDPEVFFGARADYMLDVLLGEDDDPYEQRADPKWRVLLMEDTGEILAADAKEKTGQALSRLLNVVDGLIGQGLRILVLVTTNEELKRLHPAVSRPGRCAARIQFVELSADEAREWAAAHGATVPHERATIAELYGKVYGYASVEAETIGFS